MLRPFSVVLAILAMLVQPSVIVAQDVGPGLIRIDSLGTTFKDQARTRFRQAGVEVTATSWGLLSSRIDRGMIQLRDDGLTEGRIAQARASLNTVVDWMVEAATVRDGGRVVGETSFDAAMRKCPPPKYPLCP